MKALVLKQYNELIYQDVDMPKVGSEEVLIQVKACGICGSDVHGVDGSTGRRIPPLIMGHEGSGVIVEKGSGVSGYVEGDRVTFDSTLYCGICPYCLKGAVNLCDNRRVLGVSCAEFHYNGAFAEFVAVPSRCLYPLPEGLSFEKAAMVEPVSIAVHGVSRTSLKINDSALVIGCGIIGLLVIQVLRLAGCRTIIGVDIDPVKLEFASNLGADITLDGRDPELHRLILDQSRGRGVDHAFEVVGSTPTLRTCMDSLVKGGNLVIIGNFNPSVEFALQGAVSKEMSIYGSCASNGEYPDCLDLIVKEAIDLDPLISAVAPLSEGASWFDRLYRAEERLFKVILKP